uniref:Uncharacterized protein n=1 Tax=uncultured Armatimonadetes bacterium TaxID=157466 RepID=A0A6J4IER2_9BACT|nr:hypothetical protein AVDCRST_MAG63-1793 [uncultured Armatimonadetes bacterium]
MRENKPNPWSETGQARWPATGPTVVTEAVAVGAEEPALKMAA